jgi:hypothetical protein
MDINHPHRKITAFQLLMLVLSVYVLGALLAEATLQLSGQTRKLLGTFDTLICFIFLADFFYRLRHAENKLAFMKWGWIDLISSIPMLDVFRWGRLIRIVRILRILRGVRSVKVILSASAGSATISDRRRESPRNASKLPGAVQSSYTDSMDELFALVKGFANWGPQYAPSRETAHRSLEMLYAFILGYPWLKIFLPFRSLEISSFLHLENRPTNRPKPGVHELKPPFQIVPLSPLGTISQSNFLGKMRLGTIVGRFHPRLADH